MSDTARDDQEFRQLVESFLENELTIEQAARLRELMKSSAECRAAYRQQATLHALLTWQNGASSPSEAPLPDTASFIAEMLEEDERARDMLQKQSADLQEKQKAARSSTRKSRLSAKRALNDVIPGPVLIIGAIAAVLIVALIIAPTWNSPSQSVAATLTSQHDAIWEGEEAPLALAEGDALKVGTRLSLTSGVATITLGRGAVAKVQSPCTIELLSDNSMLMLEGLMLGEVVVEDAKGFLVRTPQAKVTDLGTRFGVNVTKDQGTEVHVFDGKVEAIATTAPADAEPVVLIAGESVLATKDEAVAKIAYNAQQFSALLSRTFSLPGTGQNRGNGQADPNWKLVAVDGNTLQSPRPLRVGGARTHLAIHPNDPSRSQWLTWMPPKQELSRKECVYLVRTEVELPQSINPQDTRVSLNYMADNELRAIYINGNRVELPKVDVTDMFTKFHKASISEHWVAGRNTVEFELVNLLISGNSSGEAGLRLTWDVVGTETPSRNEPE